MGSDCISILLEDLNAFYQENQCYGSGNFFSDSEGHLITDPAGSGSGLGYYLDLFEAIGKTGTGCKSLSIIKF